MKKRLSFVLSSLHLSGGVQVVIEYANRLAERGHTINLITPKGTIATTVQTELKPQVKVHESQLDLNWPPTTMREKLCLIWSLSQAVPPSDIICSTHTPTIPSAWLAARFWQKAKLFWLHQDYDLMFKERFWERQLLHHTGKWHDRVLAVSQLIYNEVKQQGTTQVIYVGEGLSHSEFLQPIVTKESKPYPTIMYLGDSRPRKGLSDFLQAMQLLHQKQKNIHLIIVSKENLNLAHVTIPFQFIYLPATAELARHYAESDIFVSTSWGEGFGLPPLEAMACGTPVVLTDSGGVRDYAQHGENCLMIPPRQPEAIAQAVYQVLTQADLAQKLRQKGLETAAQFHWDKAVDRFEQAILL